MNVADPLYAISLPYRSADPIDPAMTRTVAVEAEDAGFCGLWVSERTVGSVYCLDPVVALSTAAALTSRIRLGVAVVVSTVHNTIRLAHQYGSLDTISGGRLTLGIGIGRDGHYEDFGVPKDRRITRFLEGLEGLRALWESDDVTFEGDIVRFSGISINPKPVQRPHPPIWFGGTHPDALRRAATLADGWIGPGLQDAGAYAVCVERLRDARESSGRDVADFTISKRVYVAVSNDRGQASAAMERWFNDVLRRPEMAHCGIAGHPDEVRGELDSLVATGADHLVLHPVAWSGSTVGDLAGLVAP